MLRRIHDPERGSSFVEYTGVLVLAAAIVAALAFSGIAGRVAEAMTAAVEAALGGDPVDTGDGGNGTDGGTDQGGTPPPTDHDPSGRDPAADEPAEGDVPDFAGTSGSGSVPLSEASGGGALDTALDWLGDVGTGAWDAGEDFVSGIGDGFNSLVDNGRRLLDDPGQWFSDTTDDLVETATNTWDGVTSDPLGFARDFLFSEEVQEDWANGDRLHAGSQAVVENLLGFVPIVGWGKKADRINDIADAADRRDDNDGPAQADGDDRPEDGRQREDDSPSCPFGSSFAPGTPVLLADGSYAPIEDVGVGDEVWAFDPLTGEEGPREVTHLISSDEAKTLVEITVEDGSGGTGLVTATDTHPFWVPEPAEWVEAADLAPGTWLRTSAGTWVQVTAVSVRTVTDQTVHNLTVDGLHTYYVAAGDANLLVHNENPWVVEDCSPQQRDYRTDGNGVRRPVGQQANAQALSQRASEIINDPPKVRSTTVAVVRVYNTRTGEFEIWVTSSSPKGSTSSDPKREAYFDNPPSSLAGKLEDHEKYIAGSGTHAEEALYNYLRDNPEYVVVEGGTSYNICQGEKSTGNCMPRINELGLDTGGNYPGTTYKSGKREFWWNG